MTIEQYKDPKTPMIDKFFYCYTINGGVLSTMVEFEKYFRMWISIPIVVTHYPLPVIKQRVIKELNKHFGL
jgi:hypothetical protein